MGFWGSSSHHNKMIWNEYWVIITHTWAALYLTSTYIQFIFSLDYSHDFMNLHENSAIFCFLRNWNHLNVFAYSSVLRAPFLCCLVLDFIIPFGLITWISIELFKIFRNSQHEANVQLFGAGKANIISVLFFWWCYDQDFILK